MKVLVTGTWIFASAVVVGGVVKSQDASGETVAPAQQQATCNYDVDLDFFYLGEASGLSSGRSAIMPAEGKLAGASESSAVRTLGLRKSAFNFQWNSPRGVGLQVSLRPDALGASGGPVIRELDVRSGRVVEKMPTIHLLDEYRLSISKPSAQVFLGVESAVLETIRVTPELVGFGLWIRGPEKSFSAGISAPTLVNIGEAKSEDSLGFGVSLLSGRDERHDSRTEDPLDFGASPSKRDPYWGGAVKFGAHVLSGSKVVVSTAMTEEKRDGATVRLHWYQAGVRRSLVRASKPGLLLAMEMRQLRETFKRENSEISDVTLTSVGITSAIILDIENSVLLGLWSGSGEIHPEGSVARSLPVKGVQVELGWLWHIEDQLELAAIASREWRRDGHDVGGTSGAFPHGDGMRSAQSRVGVQISYKLGGQI